MPRHERLQHSNICICKAKLPWRLPALLVDTGARVLAASCVRPSNPDEGGSRIRKSFGGAQNCSELMMSTILSFTPSEFRRLELKRCESGRRFPSALRETHRRGAKTILPRIAVDHDACISATAAFAAATKLKTILSWPHGKRLFRGHAFDLNSRWAIPHVFPAANALLMPKGLTNKALWDRDRCCLDAQIRSPRFCRYGLKGLRTFLELNRGAIVKRRFRKGETFARR